MSTILNNGRRRRQLPVINIPFAALGTKYPPAVQFNITFGGFQDVQTERETIVPQIFVRALDEDLIAHYLFPLLFGLLLIGFFIVYFTIIKSWTPERERRREIRRYQKASAACASTLLPGYNYQFAEG